MHDANRGHYNFMYMGYLKLTSTCHYSFATLQYSIQIFLTGAQGIQLVKRLRLLDRGGSNISIESALSFSTNLISGLTGDHT